MLAALGLGAGAVVLGGSTAVEAGPICPVLFHPTNNVGSVIFPYGADWQWAKGTDGKWKKHVGVDIGGNARKGTPVFAAADGTMKIQFVDPTWKGCMVIEHTDALSCRFTTVYWHVVFNTCFARVRRGQQIATIADLCGLTTNHLHFGLRLAPYSAIAQRGALPQTAGGGDPAFPEFFVRPL
jgi:murein DD-endopeptidase MepM/ murein hydrolase activator NlpD